MKRDKTLILSLGKKHLQQTANPVLNTNNRIHDIFGLIFYFFTSVLSLYKFSQQ